MWDGTADAAYWVLLVVQVLGIGGTVAARTIHSEWGHMACYAGILLVGAASIFAMCHGSGLWMSGGTTLAVMALGATWESQTAENF